MSMFDSNLMPDNATETPVATVTAIGALVSPLWLHTLSDWAALVLPILGAAYLLLQLYIYVRTHFFQKKGPSSNG